MNNTDSLNLREDGARHEDIALEYLLSHGYVLVKRNFHFGRAGEIDLVMRSGDCYVFVEVKARRSRTFGLPEEAVTEPKRARMRKIAEGFFYVMGLHDHPGRFDVVAVDYVTGSNGRPEIRHYPNAF